MASSAKGKGSIHSRAPKYQNAFTFKHNKNSKTTKKILGISHSNLCKRCNDQIEWRKKYRKYKPIKQAKKCRKCEQKKVKLAYHVICNDCCSSYRMCAKCMKDKGALDESRTHIATVREVEKILQSQDMRERDKRTLLRKVADGKIEIEAKGEEYLFHEIEVEELDEEVEEEMEIVG